MAITRSLFLAFALLVIAITGATGMSAVQEFTVGSDIIPNFARNPTVQSVASGMWSAGSTWDTGAVPGPTDIVLVSHAVTYGSLVGSVDTIGIASGGVLSFMTDRSTKLFVANLLVMPGGTFRIGTKTAPLPANFTAEVVITDKPLDTVADSVGVYDPFQFGTGFIAIDGTVEIFGEVKTSFIRVAVEPRKWNNTLVLEQAPVGWQVGDRLFVPGTVVGPKLAPLTHDDVVVAAVSGTTVTLQSPLIFDHLGARDADGTIRLLPHAANMSRNIVIRSEDPLGTRGHVMFLHRAAIDVEHTLFKNLGRTTHAILNNTKTVGGVTTIGTNQIGRYALHIHHLIGPLGLPASTPQYSIVGNAIEDSLKWGIAIHDAHYGLVDGNVILRSKGAGLVTEDGTESFNVIANNMAINIDGTNGAIYSRTNDYAHEGTGFWFRGAGNNYMRNNVSAWATSDGITFGNIGVTENMIPAFKGADKRIPGEGVQMALPTTILEFSGNEVYGQTGQDLNLWGVGQNGGVLENAALSVVDGFKSWGSSKSGIIMRANNVTYKDAVMRVVKPGTKIGIMAMNGRYSRNIKVLNPDIQGLDVGIQPPTMLNEMGLQPALPFLIEGGMLKNNVSIRITLISMNTAQGPSAYVIPPRQTIIRNVKYGAMPGKPLKTIQMWFPATWTNKQLSFYGIQKDATFVEDYNGIPGSNFRVYFLQQAPAFVVPQTSSLFIGSPVPGLTNAQNWATHGIAIGGEVAPCANVTAHPEILGFTC